MFVYAWQVCHLTARSFKDSRSYYEAETASETFISGLNKLIWVHHSVAENTLFFSQSQSLSAVSGMINQTFIINDTILRNVWDTGLAKRKN